VVWRFTQSREDAEGRREAERGFLCASAPLREHRKPAVVWRFTQSREDAEKRSRKGLSLRLCAFA
jgi:hypothetical protein